MATPASLKRIGNKVDAKADDDGGQTLIAADPAKPQGNRAAYRQHLGTGDGGAAQITVTGYLIHQLSPG